MINKIKGIAVETILIVDDDKDLQFNLAHILEDEGYKTFGVERAKQEIPDIKRISPWQSQGVFCNPDISI